MRATTHNGRWGRGGAYSTKHNDRQFDIDNEPHINANKICENIYWDCYNGFKNEKCNTGNTEIQTMNFDSVEKKFYEENFADYLKERNQKYINRRQYKNVWTADDYRKRKNTCPEETIFQIGKQGETVDAEILKNVFQEFKKWHEEKYPQVKILDFALHCDEATPHIQMRRVWVAEENGKKCVSQNKVLKELGIEKPNENKELHRWNNPKQTFTDQCREKFLSLCENYGLEIERKPKEASKVGLDLTEYKTHQEEQKLQDIKLELEKLKTENKNLKTENEELKKNCHIMKVMKSDYKKWLDQASDELPKKEERLKVVKAELDKGERELQNVREIINKRDVLITECESAKNTYNELEEKVVGMVKPILNLKEAEKNNDLDARELAINEISQAVNKILPRMDMYNDIYQANFERGYQKFSNANPNVDKGEKGLAFMKEVVRVHGTNTDKIVTAVNAVVSVNRDNSPRNIRHLMAGTMASVPYKQSQSIGGRGILAKILDKISGKVDKWASLVMYTKHTDLDDWNMLSETEKADRLAHQSMDNYG